MNYVVEMASGGSMIHKPSSINISSGAQKLLRGNIHRHTWTAGDNISLLCFFFKLKEVDYKYFLRTKDL
jgi:hypothetical protein